jgi:hypothetical protein
MNLHLSRGRLALRFVLGHGKTDNAILQQGIAYSWARTCYTTSPRILGTKDFQERLFWNHQEHQERTVSFFRPDSPNQQRTSPIMRRNPCDQYYHWRHEMKN